MSANIHNSTKPVGHIPLLWLSLPVLVAIALIQSVPAFRMLPLAQLVILGLLGSLLSLVLAFRNSPFSSFVWITSFPLSAFLLALAYGQWRLGAESEPAREIVPREVEILVQVEQRPKLLSSGKSFTTIVRVIRAPVHLAYLENESIPLLAWCEHGGKLPEYKSKVLLRAELRTVASLEASPYRDYLLREGFGYQLGRGRILDVIDEPPFPHDWLQHTYQRFETILHYGADSSIKETYANIASGMMLGSRSALNDEQRTLFARSGTMHLFAISGLHVGILALVIGTMFELCRIPRRLIPLFAIPALGLYVAITGGSPSAIRAWGMISLFWLGYVSRRQAQSHGTLFGSLIIVLLVDPLQIGSIGFRLSYSVVFAIIFYGLPLASYWQDRWKPYQHIPEDDWTRLQWIISRSLYWLAGGLAISLAATMASLPWTLGYFQMASLIGVLVNTLLAPISILVISSGALSLLSALLGIPVLSILFNHACWTILALMEMIIVLSLKIPFSWQEWEFRHPCLPVLTETVLLILMAWVGCRRKLSAWHLAVPPLFLVAALVFGAQAVT